MKNIDDIITIFGGRSTVAGLTGNTENVVSVWKIRGQVPAAYWHRLVTASDGKVTFEDFENLKNNNNPPKITGGGESATGVESNG